MHDLVFIKISSKGIQSEYATGLASDIYLGIGLDGTAETALCRG